MTRLLVVEHPDSVDQRLHRFLERRGIEPIVTGSVALARQRLSEASGGLILADDVLPDGRGADLIGAEDHTGQWSLVLMGAEPQPVKLAAGGDGWMVAHVPKPVDCRRLTPHLRRLGRNRLPRVAAAGHSAADPSEPRWGIIGESNAIREVKRLIEMAGPTEAPVLIHGASGTGKELVARALHDAGPRRDAPFVAINCGAIPPSLIDSELFGHVKGAFTGALRDRRGVFEAAGEGTLFLDEITEMSPLLQTRLLRVLEVREAVPVGGERAVPVRCRFVAATNRCPQESVKSGRLREDLYYRLSVIPIRLPPLRERGGDVQLLADRYLAALNTQYRKTKTFSTDALESLVRHPWPGNIRELRNAIQRSFILSGSTIDAIDLSPVSSADPRWSDRPRVDTH